MPINFDQDEAGCLIRLNGELGLANAAELHTLLIQALNAGKSLRLDLEEAEIVDLTTMQLLEATLHEAEKSGIAVGIRLSNAVETALGAAGLGSLSARCSGKNRWQK